ncbi:MAG: hypothetical protein QMB24_01070 [Spirosomataceae bacterium]|jgi:hypothetical protein
MKKLTLHLNKLLSPLTLVVTMAFFGIIFHDWEGAKAGFFGTCEPELVVDYSGIIFDSLLVSFPVAFAVYFSKNEKVKG